MPRFIPQCPTFPTIIIAGIEHQLTPNPKRLDDFLGPALQGAGLGSEPDAGAAEVIMPSLETWWPEPACPVETTIEDEETGEIYPRWPTEGYDPNESTLVAAYPEDAAEINAFCRWQRLKRERLEALHAIRQAVKVAGKLRRYHVLEHVVNDLESQAPGLVRHLVSEHCADGHICSAVEHDVILPDSGPQDGPTNRDDQ